MDYSKLNLAELFDHHAVALQRLQSTIEAGQIWPERREAVGMALREMVLISEQLVRSVRVVRWGWQSDAPSSAPAPSVELETQIEEARRSGFPI